MTNKIALITGGNRGIGKESARALAADGVDVIITYRSHDAEASAVVAGLEAQGRRAAALRLDVAEVDTFPDFAARLGDVLASWDADGIDFLVNNAGHGDATPLGTATPEAVDHLINVHFRGVFFLIQTLAPTIRDGGAIVNLSSGLSRFVADGVSVYGAMKGAIDVLTRYLAKELGSRGIRVNAVAPGPIATDFGGGTMRDNEPARAAMSALSALGRVGNPEDVGAVIASLLSDRSAWVTGQRIEASGGTLL